MNRNGSVTVFVCIFFAALMVMIFAFINASKQAAVSSSAEALASLWADSVMAEYDLNLQKRYNVFGFYGYPSDASAKIDFYAEESFGEKKYIDYGGSSCSLYEYSLVNPDILEEQLVKAGKLALTEKFIRPSREITPVQAAGNGAAGDGAAGNGAAVDASGIFEDLPSEGSSKSISASAVADALKNADSFRDVIRETGKDGFVHAYILHYFKNRIDEKNLGKTYLNGEIEYIICGKQSDEANQRGIRARITAVREPFNLLYLNQNPKKRAQAFAAAQILTPGPAAAATAEAILAAWALAESDNDYRLLLGGHKVALTKSERTWAVDLDSVLANTASGYIFTGVDEGESYEDYLSLFTYTMDGRVRLLRIMDLIQMNMRYMYYSSFLLREYNGGLQAVITVNGEKHEVAKTY